MVREKALHDSCVGRIADFSKNQQFAPYRIEQADLNEDGSLVPVDMLMDQLIAFEFDDSHSRNLDRSAGRSHSRKQPVHLRGLCEVHDEFIHDAACADRAGNRREPEIGRIHAYEMILVEALELIVSDSPGYCGDVIDVAMEQFETNTNVEFAVVLLTADDRGGTKDQTFEDQRPRARQNVLFELGFFVAKLGSDRVCAIYESEVELRRTIQG